jgi:serine/threonine protein kinase
MSDRPLYEWDASERDELIRVILESEHKGKIQSIEIGQAGRIYSIGREEIFPPRIAVKCPNFRQFSNRTEARVSIELCLHEAFKTHNLFRIPWINRLNGIRIILGWPFLSSTYKHGTLGGLIADPLGWTIQDKFCSIIQIVRALRLASESGISAHQDLKPANIFFSDMHRGQPELKRFKGIRFHMYLADFGLADAFKDFGKNGGSRPYMPPEQLASAPIERDVDPRLDVFALGVICHECFTDGYHPIGEITSNIWPWLDGMPPKWKRDKVWKTWANKTDKPVPKISDSIPDSVTKLILAALAPTPSDRPSLADFEACLWSALNQFDSETCEGLRMQIDWFENKSLDQGPWPHMDDQLRQLREFYSET